MLPSVLLLDDEQEVLNALQRVLRSDYQVHAFTDAAAAIAFFQETPTQLVITDMKMPNINGADFLAHIVKINSRSKRIVLTGYADTELAKKAINEGKISAYLTKPWDNGELKATLAKLITELRSENKKLAIVKSLKLDNQRLSANQSSMEKVSHFIQAQHNSVVNQSQKLSLLNNELLQLSANLVAMQTHDITGHTFRVAQQSKMLARRMKLKEPHRVHVYLAGLFYRIGISSLPATLTTIPWHKMTIQEQQSWIKYPQVSAEILTSVASLSPCAKIIKHINEHYDGSGVPEHLTADEIPITSRILAIVAHFDLLVSGQFTGLCISPQEALIIMKKSLGNIFDSKIFYLFSDMLNDPNANESLEIAKAINELKPEMVLAQDILNHEQHKLLSEKTVLSQAQIDSLVSHQELSQKRLIAYVLHQGSEINKQQKVVRES